MNEYSTLQINFGVENVLFNKIINRRSNIKNMICLSAKQYIYRQKCISEPLNSIQFCKEVKLSEKYEKYYAIKNNNLHKHMAKWYGKDQNRTNTQNFIEQYLHML